MYDKVKFGKDGAQLPLAPSSDIQKTTRGCIFLFHPISCNFTPFRCDLENKCSHQQEIIIIIITALVYHLLLYAKSC